MRDQRNYVPTSIRFTPGHFYTNEAEPLKSGRLIKVEGTTATLSCLNRIYTVETKYLKERKSGGYA